MRKNVYRVLRHWAFRGEPGGSTRGSVYYKLSLGCANDIVVRISNHEVPETEERVYNRESGGFTWSGAWQSLVTRVPTRSTWQLVSRRVVQRWLLDMRKEILRVAWGACPLTRSLGKR